MSAEPAASRAVLPALIVISTGAMTSATLTPVLVGLYIDELRLSAAQASLAVAAEQLAYAAGLFLFYLVLHRLRRPLLAATGLVIMIAASIATALVGGAGELLAVRGIFGLAMGFAAATVFAAYAGRPDPRRVWAIATFVNLIYAALLLSASGWIIRSYGLMGVTGILAAMSLIGLICTPLIPPAPSRTGAAGSAKPPAVNPTRAAVCGALALFCLYAAHTTLWSFQERMGLAVGLNRDQVGLLLAVSVLGAVLGSVIAMAVGTRFGSRGPNLLAFAGLVASAILLATPNATAYVAGAVIIKTAWFFGLPFILGAIARADTSGRWSSAGAALLALGSAAGPTVAATVANHGLQAIGVLAALFYVASYVFTVPLFAAESSSEVNPE